MSQPGAKTYAFAKHDGLAVTAYPGDGCMLLAMDLEQPPRPGFAGFAIRRVAPDGKAEWLPNRLNFDKALSPATTPERHVWTPSNEAPFAKFRWIDFPSRTQSGSYRYEVSAMRRRADGKFDALQSVSLALPLEAEKYPNFGFGFTRGYLSSQAYATEFKNAPLRPGGKKTLEYDTGSFAQRYAWLGYSARRMVFDFLDEATRTAGATLDLFAYDLDEPDFVRGLVGLKKRLRAFLDDAKLHVAPSALEPKAYRMLVASAGADNIRRGHFKRFAHDKVMVLRVNGAPVKVLTGSANFSVRGLYVQANNVLVFDDPEVAKLYAQAFDEAFDDPSKSQAAFSKAQVASKWFDLDRAGLPACGFCFSPHRDADISLDRVAEAIRGAKSSVMFAIMSIGSSGGPVMDCVRGLDKLKVFSYGVTQDSASLKIFPPGSDKGLAMPFDYLDTKVPKPFVKEWRGGPGQVVHHKFVVVDFNADAAAVFTGSSNLASGGETSNGDNLIAIRDRGVAAAYAIEAVRLLDHYHFRRVWKTGTSTNPLILSVEKRNGKYWWEPYFDSGDVHYRDRLTFSRMQEES